jgi:hypothetical protein
MRRLYESLRRRYFVDPGEHRVLPPHGELRWHWLPLNSDALGVTTWDDDGDPIDLGFAPLLRSSLYLSRHIMLHEQTHMRLGPGPSCGGFSHAWSGPRIARSSLWHAETVRLVDLGAFQL